MADPELQTLLQRLDRDPDDAQAFDALWKLCRDRKQYDQLVVIAEKLAGRSRRPEQTAELWFCAGKTLEDELRKLDKAVAAYDRALEFSGKHFQAAKALAELHFRRKEYDRAAAAYQRQIDATESLKEKVSILEDLIEARDRLEDGPGKIAALRQLADLQTLDVERLRQLTRALVDQIRAGDASERDRIDAARYVSMLASHERESLRLGLAEEALSIWPGDEAALELFESEATAAGRSAAVTLKRIEFLTSNPESKIAPRVRRDLGNHYRRIGQIESAIEALIPLRNTDSLARDALAQMYRDTNRHAELAELLASAEGPRRGQTKSDVLHERAELHRASGDRTSMLARFVEIMAMEPGDEKAFAELEAEYRGKSAFLELRDLLSRSTQNRGLALDARVQRLWQAAYLSEQHLSDPTAAVDLWKALRVVSPDHPEAIAGLDRLLLRLERWDELLELLESRARVEKDPTAQRTLWLRYVEIHRFHRNDPAVEGKVLSALWSQNPNDDGIAVALADARRRSGDLAGVEEIWRAMLLAATPENLAARGSALASLLEQTGRAQEALEAWQRVRTQDSNYAMAWDAEERLLESAGKWTDLLPLLIAHAGHPVAAGRNAGALYLRAARVAQRLGDPAAATEFAERSLRFANNDPALLDLLAGLYETAGETTKLDQIKALQAAAMPAVPVQTGPSLPAPITAPRESVPPAMTPSIEPTAEVESELPTRDPNQIRVAPPRIGPPAMVGTEPPPARGPAPLIAPPMINVPSSNGESSSGENE